MRLLTMLLISLAICLQSLAVSATTLSLVPPAPHGPGPGAATIVFNVDVSDGFTTTRAIQKGQVLLAADGTATIEVQPFGLVFPVVYWSMEGVIPWVYMGVFALAWVWWAAAIKLWPAPGEQPVQPIAAD